jgi:hypothetical protein
VQVTTTASLLCLTHRNALRDVQASELARNDDQFLDRYQIWWNKSPQRAHEVFAANPQWVRKRLTEWAEKKLASVIEAGSLDSFKTNIMFKQLLYADDAINFGSSKTNWKKKIEIVEELKLYKPWSMVHAAAFLGGRAKLRKHVEAILEHTDHLTMRSSSRLGGVFGRR